MDRNMAMIHGADRLSAHGPPSFVGIIEIGIAIEKNLSKSISIPIAFSVLMDRVGVHSSRQ
jgi:hypothetical protein